jgi:predicted DNA-binding transcriptional regulator YafY
MYHGDKEHIELRAKNKLLDTFVDRFGTKGVIYSTDGEGHFIARVTVSVSDQFFGWLCGLADNVKIVSPAVLEASFKEYLMNISRLYN